MYNTKWSLLILSIGLGCNSVDVPEKETEEPAEELSEPSTLVEPAVESTVEPSVHKILRSFLMVLMMTQMVMAGRIKKKVLMVQEITKILMVMEFSIT